MTSPLLTRAFRRGWLADELMNMAVMLAKATRKISSQQHRYIRFSYFQFVFDMMVNIRHFDGKAADQKNFDAPPSELSSSARTALPIV